MAPNHYLNQFRLNIKSVFWCFTRSAHELNLQQVFQDYIFKITTISPRGQWVFNQKRLDVSETDWVTVLLRGLMNCYLSSYSFISIQPITACQFTSDTNHNWLIYNSKYNVYITTRNTIIWKVSMMYQLTHCGLVSHTCAMKKTAHIPPSMHTCIKIFPISLIAKDKTTVPGQVL